MGNPDLLIIINRWFTFHLRGVDYIDRESVITLALQQYIKYQEKAKKSKHYNHEADFDWTVQTINCYEIPAPFTKDSPDE